MWKCKNTAIWLNINPICATGKSIIVEKKISIWVIVQGHNRACWNCGTIYFKKKEGIWGLWPCPLFTNGQLEIEKVQKFKVTQLISSSQDRWCSGSSWCLSPDSYISLVLYWEGDLNLLMTLILTSIYWLICARRCPKLFICINIYIQNSSLRGTSDAFLHRWRTKKVNTW